MAGMPKQTPLPFPDAEPARPDPTEPSNATPAGPAQPADTGAEDADLAVAAEPAPEAVAPTTSPLAIEESVIEASVIADSAMADAVAPSATEAAADAEPARPQPDPAQTELPIGAIAPRPGLDVRQYQSRRPWWARLLGSIMAPWVQLTIEPEAPAKHAPEVGGRPVCYVLEDYGLSNALILERACREAGLPRHCSRCRAIRWVASAPMSPCRVAMPAH
jgi:glycerol-3-phosphate O-acyltransferase